MQLPLGRDLLKSALKTCGSLAGRGKTPTKGYFPGNGPLLMQDMAVGGLFMKRKCSREPKPPILLRCGAEEQRPPRPGWAEPRQPPAASSRHRSAPTAPQRSRGSPHLPAEPPRAAAPPAEPHGGLSNHTGFPSPPFLLLFLLPR